MDCQLLPHFFIIFFINKIFLSETKSSGKGQSCSFIFTFFSKFVGDYTVLLSSCIPKRVVQKASYFFYIIIIVSWIQKWDFISHFSYTFFSFINISSCKMICSSFFSLIKLWCNRVDEVRIFFIQLLLGRVKKIV